MSKQRRTFSPEFKQQAACLVLDQGYSHVEASRLIGVGESLMRRWVQQLQLERQGVTPQSKAITPNTGKPGWLRAPPTCGISGTAVIDNVSISDLRLMVSWLFSSTEMWV